MGSPFSIGSSITWANEAPQTWHFIFTPGPMQVVSARWDAGRPTEYSLRFGGISRAPGWIITVEYDADSTKYYDPPLSILIGKKRLKEEIHEQWLRLPQ